MAEVQIKSTQIIKPAEKTWTGTMKLSDIDMAMAKGFVPKLYVYRPNKEWDAAAISRTLKESLGKALVHFYPFLGRLRPTEGGRVELVVDDEDEATWGVPLVEAETAVEVADLGDLEKGYEKGQFKGLFWMVDYMKPQEELPLLAVQLTHFRCGGVGVGITWSHAVVDGVGAGHFYSEWTRLARGEPVRMAPLHDRTLLRAGEPPRSISYFIQKEAAPPTPLILPTETDDSKPTPAVQTPFAQTTTLKLLVSKSQIKRLKESVGHVISGRPYTRFEVLTAYAWRCAGKTKGQQHQKQNALSIALDIRKRINPPLPLEFTGNAVVITTATSESEDLISKPLCYACDRIRQTIDKVTEDFVWAYIDYQKSVEDLGVWRGTVTPEGLFVNPYVMMVSWLNLAFHNLDFGWGNETHMESAPMSWEGVACLLEGPEEGSAIVVMCLQDAHVEKFKEYFFHELK